MRYLTHCLGDVTSEESINAALNLIEKEFGGPINVAVNCAGIAIAQRTIHPKKGPHPLADFARILQVTMHPLPRLTLTRLTHR